jgi:predicted DsbA family dithiol-disulfide isomerase
MKKRSCVWLALGLALPVTATAAEKKEGAEAAGSETLAAQVGPAAVTAARVDELARERLARVKAEEYKVRRQALDEEIERLLLAAEAKARQTTVEALLRSEVDGRVAPVSDESVRAAYQARRDRQPGVPEAEALPRIREGLQRQAAAQRRREFLDELRRKAGVKVFLEAPRIAVDASGGPAKGPDSAPVTILTFSDFQCPYCQKLAVTLERLEEQYRGKVRLVFRDFPLPFHKEAGPAAEAGACAHEQGRFWAMHDKLFANQKALQAADLKRYAGELGLDRQAFDACLDGGRQAQAWQRGREQGERYGVTGTPATFINGRLVNGTQPLTSLVEIVEEELGRARASASGGR